MDKKEGKKIDDVISVIFMQLILIVCVTMLFICINQKINLFYFLGVFLGFAFCFFFEVMIAKGDSRKIHK